MIHVKIATDNDWISVKWSGLCFFFTVEVEQTLDYFS